MTAKTTGQSISKVTDEADPNAIRRAVKARQRAAHRSTTSSARRSAPAKSKGGFTWRAEESPMHAASRPRHEVDPFDIEHAGRAMECRTFTANLTAGSPAQVLGTRALLEYPQVSSLEGNLQQRADIAVTQAAAALTSEGTTRITPGVINRAKRFVTTSLKQTRREAREATAV